MQALPRNRNLICFFLYAAFIFKGICGGSICAQELEACQELSYPRPVIRQDTLTICFMGDMMMHAQQIEKSRRKDGTYDFSSYFSMIEDRIKSADIAVANMEFTLGGEPYSGYPAFSAPDSYASYLADCGFDVFLAANNHIMDTKSAGAARTAEIYRNLEKQKGISFTGLAENEEARTRNYPLLIRRKGILVSFLNFTYGTNLGADEHWPKTNYIGKKSEILKALEASEQADISIALPHWGPEYQLRHSESQEETAAWLAENGADIVIGTHPHVVQDTAYINDVPVLYSLGNAVSNMSAVNTQLELMAVVKIVRHENGKVSMLTPELTWLWCSRPGGYGDDYTVVPVEDQIGRRAEWMGGWEYDKMMSAYERIRKTE
jgi:poly-gamma-glutamate synthesis protein (capsule biosynthesis protein)